MHHEHERDTLAFTHQLYTETPRQLAFQATTVPLPGRNVATRIARQNLLNWLAVFPQEKCDLQPEVLESREFADYTRETVQFRSRPHSVIFGYFLSPKNVNSSTPNPTILCLAGHGRGVDDIVGIEEDGSMREGIRRLPERFRAPVFNARL